MSKISDSFFAAAFDSALHNYPTRVDLTGEIMATLRSFQRDREKDFGVLLAMAEMSGGQVFGRAHLTRLRAEYSTKQGD